MGRPMIANASLLVLAFMLVSGCTQPESSGEDLTQKGDGIHRNAEGQIICPVYKVVIDSPEAAEGSMILDGVTYYFSLEGAVELFEANPSEFID